MLEILGMVVSWIGKILTFWQGMEIKGFRPFWFIVGCGFLTLFGSVLTGIGNVGGIASGVAAKAAVRSKVKIIASKKKNNKE